MNLLEKLKAEKPLKGKVIVIDPGHGGEDPGTSAWGYKEKDAAFAIALTVKYLLYLAGARTIITRTGDYRPSYRDRIKPAWKYNADAFISIHFDWPMGRRMVYYAAEKRGRKPSKRLAELVAKYINTDIVRPSTSSRFGRLYIDDTPVKTATILVEVDRITNFAPGRHYRLDRGGKIVQGVIEFFKEKEQ